MRLRWAIDVSLDISEFGGIDMSGTWGEDAAEKMRKREQHIEVQNKVLLEKRKLLEEQGPGLWQEVRNQVKKLCAELNSCYGKEIATIRVGQTRELHIELYASGTMSELNASFEPSSSSEALQWSYSGPAARIARGGKYYLYVDNGSVVFQNGLDPPPQSPSRGR